MRRFVLFSALTFVCLSLSAAGVVINSGINYLQYAILTRCSYDVNVENQIAVVTVTETFRNNQLSNMAPRYFYPLPDGASATQLRWFAAGMWFSAIISPNPQNPPGGPSTFPTSFLNYVGPFPIIFDFITVLAPTDTMTVELTYVQLLPYSSGNVDLVLRNNTLPLQSSSLQSQALDVHLVSDRLITGFQMLSHPSANVDNNGEVANAHYLSYNSYANLDYHLRYTLSSTQLGLWAMSTYLDSVPDLMGRGFFTFIVEPDPTNTTQVIDKVFTLIIDRSGSMGFENKITQAKNAATYIVNNLNEGDLFNIVIFNAYVQPLWTTHQPRTPANISSALNFINSITATGNTNIQAAFDVSVPQFVNASDSTANIIIFLTDGQPTSGITNTQQLVNYVDNLININEADIYLFNFGIGSDVNHQLLTLLADHNNGVATFLGNSELYATITDFYNLIRNPVILNPVFSVNPIAAVHDVYPSDLPNLYLGKQMIVSGRYDFPQPVTINFSGNAYNQPVNYQYPLTLSETDSPQYQFLPKIWAKQYIETLLIQYYSLDPNSFQAIELKQTIISVSIMWGIITPFTSFTGGTDIEDDTENSTPPVEIVNLTNYPNPFNPTTTISFEVVKDIKAPAIIKIYNTKGQLIRILAINVKGKGKYQVVWDGRDKDGKIATSGVYFYTLSFGNTVLSNKMTLLK